jgi:hypothetical protein
VDEEVWEDLEFPSHEAGDDDAEVLVIPGGGVEMPPLGGGRGGFIPKPLSKLASSSSSIPFSPISAARTRGVTSQPTRISQPYGTRSDEQIHITGFTLVRFTSGPILEDVTRTCRVACEPATTWVFCSGSVGTIVGSTQEKAYFKLLGHSLSTDTETPSNPMTFNPCQRCILKPELAAAALLKEP